MASDMDLLLGQSQFSKGFSQTTAETEASHDLDQLTRRLLTATNSASFDIASITSLTNPKLHFTSIRAPPTTTREAYISNLDTLQRTYPKGKAEIASVEVDNVDVKNGNAEVMVFAEFTGTPVDVVRQGITVYKWRRNTNRSWMCYSIESILQTPFGDGTCLTEDVYASLEGENPPRKGYEQHIKETSEGL